MKSEAENCTILFGSCIIQNCRYVIEFVGKGINRQIMRFREGEDGTVLFDGKVYDATGKTVLVIANSKIQYLEEGHNAEVTPHSIIVGEKNAPLKILFELIRLQPRRFLLSGHFFLPGYEILAADNGLFINGELHFREAYINLSAAIGLI